MKAPVLMAVLSLSVLGLAACATTEESSYKAPERKASPLDNDTAYMARVEAIARRRGIGVTWVNPPRKSVAKKDD